MQNHPKLVHPPGSGTPRCAQAGLIRRPLVWVLVSLWLGGCGAGVEGKGPQDPGAEPATVAETTAKFDQAERDLRDSLQVSGLDYHDDTGPGVGAQPAQPGYPPPGPPPPASERAHETSDGRSRCDLACRALASMERSAERLCSLAGEGDQRCENVRHRVRAARRLVRLWCPDCHA